MSEDNIKETLDDAVDSVSDTVEELKEETLQEASDAAETLDGIKNEAEEAVSEKLGSIEEEISGIKDDIPDSYKTDPVIVEKASRKTTIVLGIIIVVLIALIGLFAWLIASKIINDKKAKSTDPANDITLAPAVTGTTDNGSADNGSSSDDGQGSSSETAERRIYNVTVELGQYKGIEVDFPEISIEDEDVDYEMEYFLDNLSEVVPVDRPSQIGDTLNIDYTGYMDGEEFDGGSDEDVEFVLGNYTFFDDFEAGLIDKTVGEYTLDLNFPDDYYEDLAGKPVTFVVTINSIAETVVPELNDQLIADNTEYSTVAEYRAYLKGMLEEEAIENAQDDIDGQLIMTAVENATFGGEVDDEINDLAQQYFDYYDQMAMAYYGVSGAELFEGMYGMSEEDYNATIMIESEHSVKQQHLLEKIAEAEQISYTDEEYQQEFEDIFFSYYGFTDEEEVKEQVTEEEIEEIVSKSIKCRKAQDLILDSAVIKGKPVSAE